MRFHWRGHLAVVLGVMVGTAVLTGALLVGDSLRGSLRDLTRERLGRIDHALVSERFFGDDLGNVLAQQPDFAGLVEHTAPAIILRGSVVRRDGAGQVTRRVGQVQVVGVDEDFWPLFGEARVDLANDVLLNDRLARELGVAIGDVVEVRLEKPQAVPADSILGRPVEDAGLTIEASPIATVLPDDDPGRFSLNAQQQFPLLVYVQLRRLQNRLRESLQAPGLANALLIASRAGAGSGADAEGLQAALGGVVRLEDYGLRLRADQYLSLESRRLLLEPAVMDSVLALGKKAGWTVTPTLTYLANKISRGQRFVPYSTITGLDPTQGPPFANLHLVDGGAAGTIADDDILINEWLAQDLWPEGNWRQDIGKPVVALSYFVEGDDWLLREETTTLKLGGVVSMSGTAIDRLLTPDFPGIRGTRVRDWNPPFPKEQWHPEWVRERDEEYWRKYRATPKAFVSPATAQNLWKSRHGEYTSVRVAAAGANDGTSSTSPSSDKSLRDLEADLRRRLRAALSPKRIGLVIQPVKAQGLAAAGSSTAEMFGWLFLGFSIFLIASAAMLVGLLFRLGIERRAKEFGLLYAVGFSQRTIRRLLLVEGAAITALGELLGIVLAAGYAAVLLAWLRRSWSDTLQTSFLQLHIAKQEPMFGPLPYPSLTIGLLLSLLVALFAIALALRGLRRLSPRALLAGKTEVDSAPGSLARRTWAGWFAAASLLVAGALAIASFLVPTGAAAPLFFGSGALLLLAGMSGLRRWLAQRRGPAVRGAGTGALLRLGMHNADRSPGRSLLTIGLLACATFLVVAVESFRKSADSDAASRDSGTGGFSLIARADVPLFQAPDSAEHLKALLPDADAAARRRIESAVKDVPILALRVRPGDDVSCLNLYQPQQPRILGVPAALRDRGGFAFGPLDQPTAEEKHNPWRLLGRNLGDEVPLLADEHTAEWVLHKKPGETWTIADERGRAVTVRLVGLLRGSIFQSELLMSEENFKTLFPSRGGYGLFLIDAPKVRSAEVKEALDATLGERFGFNVEHSTDRLAAFQAVENTYLSTFQALGGLGLLLGTIGLSVVLLRNVWERQGELALLRALGYARGDLGWLILAENALLVLVGLGLGILAAAVAVAPHLFERAQTIPWTGIAALVGLVLVFGLGAGLLALLTTLRMPLLPALRRE
jgi:ABC-type lipoprotein release transport system permease subunit